MITHTLIKLIMGETKIIVIYNHHRIESLLLHMLVLELRVHINYSGADMQARPQTFTLKINIGVF